MLCAFEMLQCHFMLLMPIAIMRHCSQLQITLLNLPLICPLTFITQMQTLQILRNPHMRRRGRRDRAEIVSNVWGLRTRCLSARAMLLHPLAAKSSRDWNFTQFTARMTHGTWRMAHGAWRVAFDARSVKHRASRMTYATQRVKLDARRKAHDSWRMKRDARSMSHCA